MKTAEEIVKGVVHIVEEVAKDVAKFVKKAEYVLAKIDKEVLDDVKHFAKSYYCDRVVGFCKIAPRF